MCVDVYVKVCMAYVCGCMCEGVCEGVWDVCVKVCVTYVCGYMCEGVRDVCVKVCVTHVCDVYVKVCACTSVYTEHFSVNTRMYKLVPKTQCHKSSASQ